MAHGMATGTCAVPSVVPGACVLVLRTVCSHTSAALDLSRKLEYATLHGVSCFTTFSPQPS